VLNETSTMLERDIIVPKLNRHTEKNSFTRNHDVATSLTGIYVSLSIRGGNSGETHEAGKKISTCWSRAFLFGPPLEQF